MHRLMAIDGSVEPFEVTEAVREAMAEVFRPEFLNRKLGRG